MRKIAIFSILLGILLLNSLHTTYPDEFDNILGGRLITQGILPYTGFFSHHGPLAYFFASFIYLFSRQSFVAFRLISAAFFFCFALVSHFMFRKRVPKLAHVFIIYFCFFAITATFYWGNMFLADVLSGYFLIPAFGLLFLKSFLGEKLERKDLIIISLFSFGGVLMSTTYLYAVLVLIIFSFFYFVRNWKGFVSFGIIFSTPYLVFFLYLLLTNSLSNYYFQAIEYNKNYYIYNYPRPEHSTAFNPLRYAVVILNNFINNFQVVLTSILKVDLRYPAAASFAVANVFLWIYLFFKRKFSLILMAVLFAVYINARGSPASVPAVDYQSIIYVMLSIFAAAFLLVSLMRERETNSGWVQKTVLSGFLLLFAFLWFFNSLFFGAEFWRINYSRYMGTMPLIYDRPVVAPIINRLLSTNDYCWVGPFAFEEMFYLKCKLPSKYHWILPQFNSVDKIKTELLKDFSANKPKVMVYNRYFFAFGESYEYHKFFADFVDQNYISVKNWENGKYHFLNNPPGDYSDLSGQFYLRKDVAGEMIGKLLSDGYVAGNKEDQQGEKK